MPEGTGGGARPGAKEDDDNDDEDMSELLAEADEFIKNKKMRS